MEWIIMEWSVDFLVLGQTVGEHESEKVILLQIILDDSYNL